MRVAGLIIALLAAGGVMSPAAAAPSSFAVSGAAAKQCSPTTASVTLTVVANNKDVITTTFAPASVAIWCNAAGTLSVSSTRLLKSGTTNTFSDFTLAVTGWGSAVTYVTAASPPSPSTQSSTTQTATLAFACTAGCVAGTIPKNTTYTATVTLGLSPN